MLRSFHVVYGGRRNSSKRTPSISEGGWPGTPETGDQFGADHGVW